MKKHFHKINISNNQYLTTIDIQNYITFRITFVSKEDTFSCSRIRFGFVSFNGASKTQITKNTYIM